MTDIMDLIQKKRKDIKAQTGQRENTTKLKNGKNLVRILPGWRDGDATFWHEFGMHWVKGTDGKLKAVYVCTEKTFGKPCPICSAVDEGINAGSSDDVINALKESKSRPRILVNALVRNGESPNEPVILELTQTTFDQVLALMEEYGNITDPGEEGYDLIIAREGTGFDTKYSVMPSPKSKPVNKAVLGNLTNLDDYVAQEYTEGKLKALGAVQSVSGILPPPGAAGEVSEGGLSTDFDDDVPDSVLDEADLAAAPAAAAASEEVSADAPADRKASDELSDDDLDDILNGID